MKNRFEIIFIFLYDVGRSVDIRALASELKGAVPLAIERSRDTPESLLLPIPLLVPLDHFTSGSVALAGSGFDKVTTRAKIYEEGVLTIECRAEIQLSLKELHTVKLKEIHADGRSFTLDDLARFRFDQLMVRIGDSVIQDQYVFEHYESEDYRFYCLIDEIPEPRQFIERHSDYLAPFLLGENPSEDLHQSQVDTTLKNPFSFRGRDVAVFDLDRAFILDPQRDYEDLILIVEHANYQLLELRTLDKLLDRWLDEAERDIRGSYSPRRKPGQSRRKKTPPRVKFHPIQAFASLSQKLGNLQPLRLDALFILENLENSSRIIGDYYLEQIYDHLCGLFNTQGWKKNVERRLEILQNIYTMTKSDATDRTMVILELLVVLMIGVEIIALFFPLFK